MNNLKIKAYQLVADLIDSAIIGGWDLGDDEKESIALEKEMRAIEEDLRKITYLSENQYELYLELKEVKRRQSEWKKHTSVSLNEIQDNYGNIIHDFEKDKFKLLG